MENNSNPLLVRLCDFDASPPPSYYSYILDNYGYHRFDLMLLLKMFNSSSHDISWFIKNCYLCRSNFMLDLYLQSKPSINDLYVFLVTCSFARTKVMLESFLRLSSLTEDEICYIMDGFSSGDPFIDMYFWYIFSHGEYDADMSLFLYPSNSSVSYLYQLSKLLSTVRVHTHCYLV